jgi:hypothetical protein
LEHATVSWQGQSHRVTELSLDFGTAKPGQIRYKQRAQSWQAWPPDVERIKEQQE